MAATQNVAPVKWAQRADSLYLTISLADVTNEKLELTETGLNFSGTSNGKEYSCSLTFFKPIDTEGSISKVLPQSIQMKLMKKDKEDEEFWPRLELDKTKKQTVTIDWDKYKDEDEAEGEGFDESALAGGMGMGGMGGMPGMGGMGGMPGMGGMGGMDMAKMQEMMAQMQQGGGMPGMPGMGDMGGMGGGMPGDDEEGDSDDNDDMPDLENA